MARSNLGWEPSKMEQYAERYWLVNGYDAKLIKRYISKSIYEISKDGLTDGSPWPLAAWWAITWARCTT